jgi:hypothetical protein
VDPLAAQARLNDFEVAACSRRLTQTRLMIADFERLAAELDREVLAEEERTHIRDPRNFAYSTLAKAASQRRDNLQHSIAQLKIQLDAGYAALEAALEKSQVRAANGPAPAMPNTHHAA